MSENDSIYISISGLIGAGKSTLAKALGKEMGLDVYYEPVMDNEYLQDFYTDMKKYSFPMQIHLLNKRYEQQQQIIWSKKGAIQDRTIYEDSVFAKMLWKTGKMEKRDYKTYKELFENIRYFMKHPNLIVHLDVDVEVSMRRIKERNLDCETGITIEYLKSLKEEYDLFIANISKIIPVIKVNYNKYLAAEDMARMIYAEYEKMSTIHSIE